MRCNHFCIKDIDKKGNLNIFWNVYLVIKVKMCDSVESKFVR